MVVATLVGYLGLLLFTAMPACQRWLAAKSSDILSRELQTDVQIGNARIGLLNRIVLDDVLLHDQQGDTLVSATRLSSKLDVWQLLNGRIRIANVQLFGYDIRLHRADTLSPYNFQFLIDRFASEDTNTTPLDLAINSILIRRGNISHDIDSEPFADRFTPAHTRLENFNLKAQINALTNDSISLNIKELCFAESRSNFILENLSMQLQGTLQRAALTDLSVELPQSHIEIPVLTLDDGITSWRDNQGRLLLRGQLTPADIAAFAPVLKSFQAPLHIDLQADKQARWLRLQELSLDAQGFDLQLQGHGLLPPTDSSAHPLDELKLTLDHLQMDKSFYQQILQALSNAQPQPVIPVETAEMICRLGEISLAGEWEESFRHDVMKGHLQAQTALGNVKAEGRMTAHDLFTAQAESESFQLASLLSADGQFPLNDLSLTGDFEGSVRQRHLKGSAKLRDFLVKDTRLDFLSTTFNISPRVLRTQTELIDDEYNLQLTTDLQTPKEWKIDLASLEDLQGFVGLDRVSVRHEDETYELRQLHVSTANDDHGHHLLLSGDFIEAHADGKFRYASLAPAVQQLLHQALPSLVAAPKTGTVQADERLNFSVNIWNTTQLLQLAGIDLALPQPGYIEGELNVPSSEFSVMADFPHIIYGGEEMRAVSMLARQERDSLTSFVTLQRMMESGPMDLSVLAEGGHDRLHSVLAWDDHNEPSQRGELSAIATFFKDEQSHLGADIRFQPTSIMISDTIWNVHESQVRYHDRIVDVSGFQVSQAGRHLRVDGRVSQNSADTLYADLSGINLQYIFGIIDFHDVEFEGFATGGVKIHDIYESIAVDADLRVDDLKLNGGLLGEAHVIGGFGRKDERAIDLDILVREPVRNELSHIFGIVKPGHEPGRGMELNIQARYLNIYFINFFTEGIFDNLQGRSTGYAYLHGPFKQLDLEGLLTLDTLDVGIPVLGTRYHTLGGDTLRLYPGGISVANAHIYDQHHGTDNRRHEALLSGALSFEHFKNLRYVFDIEAHDFLGYDFKEFDDQVFCGTVFADGNVHLAGQPGTLNVDVQCSPTQGTFFTYNVSTPETLTENEFITYKEKNHLAPLSPPEGGTDAQSNTDDGNVAPSGAEEGATSDEPTDMYINFDLDITPAAQMRLLMDPRTDDYIDLFGDAHIRANFYNKGRFQMYGTYRVDHGTYRLSLQDVIRKEFRFQQGSTIVFGGDPMKGSLNLQAIYTVPSVSLNDLAVGNNFSSGNVRVNCLMNIGGTAGQPQVTFDFDIPNVNEDEKQMVRSLISTDEERNLQVIYLLGIGRFYTQDLAAGQSQTNAAMTSLLSSTISGQLNNLLGTIIGNSNWNFGTSLSTGTQGWNEVDVEGMLSGRLLNNRLLINGTFGYRDTPIANTNFIGDFDVQWLLTPNGGISLKAYSETNDRYFTKTALTTQGVGIQVKKDFNTLRELFRFRRRKK